MADKDLDPPSTLTRRAFIRGLSAAGVGLAAAPLMGGSQAFAAQTVWLQADPAGTGDPEQLHLQFGADASREIVASWVTPGAARRPVLRLGTPDDGLGSVVHAETRTYIDAKSGVEVFTHHVPLRDLDAATNYVYEVLHDGAAALRGSFATAPRGRSSFRFTSFGDQATPETGNGLASIWSSYNPPQVERLRPLFHLLNGDLCYANISPDRVKTWHDFFENNQVSASRRPWMPAWQPRERAGQRPGWLRRLPDEVLAAHQRRAARTAWTLVHVPGRIRAGHLTQQRRRLLPGRW